MTGKTKVTVEPGKQEFFITREFNAPRELVFKAFTDPKLYVQWLGPRRMKMKLEKFEPRVGGIWQYTDIEPNGNEYRFRGVYHEVHPPELLIDTFEFEGMPEKGHVSLEWARFKELPGDKTELTIHSVFQSVTDRDGMAVSGMEQGISESFERLDELLAKIPLPLP